VERHWQRWEEMEGGGEAQAILVGRDRKQLARTGRKSKEAVRRHRQRWEEMGGGGDTGSSRKT